MTASYADVARDLKAAQRSHAAFIRVEQAFQNWRCTTPGTLPLVAAFRAGWSARAFGEIQQQKGDNMDTKTHPPGLDRAAYDTGATARVCDDLCNAKSLPPLFDPLREMVKHILFYPEGYIWSRQGFGMLRTYFGPQQKYRLNVWNKRFARPGVSTIHDHPWDFQSWIMGGSLTNLRYAQGMAGPNHHVQSIKTGEGGGPVGYPSIVFLYPATPCPEFYETGDSYRQKANEIHETFYADGTVTLNERSNRYSETARVFWPIGRQWIDAEPRPATPEEVTLATRGALREWF